MNVDRLLDPIPAEGICIGQIAVTAAAGGGYSLRHREDGGRPAPDLRRYASPEDATEIALYDDSGVYRPLKTAPSLRHGWSLELADTAALRLALDLFYPARLGALAAWREGRLPVTPLRETLARQSGMYRVTQRLTDEQADALVARVCRSDCGCLRTILWPRDAAGAPASPLLPREKYDTGHDQTGLPAAGARVLPLLCQEACNLLVAAARSVVKGEA